MDATDKFEDVDVYINYAFDIGPISNPIDIARNLLQNNVGQSFYNAYTDNVEVGKEYEHLSRSKDDLRLAQNIKRKRKKRLHYMKLARRYPKQFAVAMVNRVLKGREITSPFDEIDSRIRIKRIIDEIDEASIDLTSVPVLHNFVDKEIFHEDYLESSIIRVYLFPFTFLFLGEDQEVDVELTIHSSGICILTFYIFCQNGITVKQLNILKRTSHNIISTCRVRKNYIKSYVDLVYKPHNPDSKVFLPDESGYVIYDDEENPISLGVILDAYRCCILSSIYKNKYKSLIDYEKVIRSISWYSFPIIFIKGTPGYDYDHDYKSDNKKVIVELLLGIDSEFIKQNIVDDIVNSDLSITTDYSMFINESCALVIYYEKYKRKIATSTDWTVGKFRFSGVVDLLVIQKHMLTVFIKHTDDLKYDINDLYRIKNQYLYAIEEMHSIGLSHYGQVNDMVKYGQESMKINTNKDAFLAKISSIESIISKSAELSKSKRDKTIKWLTFLFTLFLGFRGIKDFVDTIAKLQITSSTPSFVSYIQRISLNYSSETIFILYSLFIVISTYILIIESFVFNNKKIKGRNAPREKQSAISPSKLEVIDPNEDDDD